MIASADPAHNVENAEPEEPEKRIANGNCNILAAIELPSLPKRVELIDKIVEEEKR